MSKTKTILMLAGAVLIIIFAIPLAYLLLIYDNAREIADKVTDYYDKNPGHKLF
jgi:hypothetical protein